MYVELFSDAGGIAGL